MGCAGRGRILEPHGGEIRGLANEDFAVELGGEIQPLQSERPPRLFKELVDGRRLVERGLGRVGLGRCESGDPDGEDDENE